MQEHLGSGCKQCAKTLTLWQKVHATAAAEASYKPPADTVRVVKAAFAATALAGTRKKANSLIEVLFDSFLQPATAGTRSTRAGTRQMLYRADSYQIDIQIEGKPEGDGLVVTGQLLEVSDPRIAGQDVQVTLSNRRGHLVHTATNQFGEFRGEVENSGDLELSFLGQGDKPVVISLRDALGETLEGSA
jgi:hypothetical protein